MSKTELTLIQPKVIDPDDRSEMERFASLHDEAWKRVRERHPERVGTPTWEIVSEQFRLFRDPTYRAKPDEPQGLGAVVASESDGDWIRVSVELANPWLNVQTGAQCHWQAVSAVRVLSSGVEVSA